MEYPNHTLFWSKVIVKLEIQFVIVTFQNYPVWRKQERIGYFNRRQHFYNLLVAFFINDLQYVLYNMYFIITRFHFVALSRIFSHHKLLKSKSRDGIRKIIIFNYNSFHLIISPGWVKRGMCFFFKQFSFYLLCT